MLKIDLITGFLESGKTTFLIQYAKYLMRQGLRIGILEYDYGAVNVDMILLNKLRGKQCELEMVAAACDKDCLRRRFQTKLISMAMSGYDRVIVEPSGVFDMDLFFDALREEPLENFYEIGSVITVVNANLRDQLSEEENYFLASQAAGAGCVVLSRCQLSDSERIANTKKHLEEAMQGIKCKSFRGNYLEKDWEMLTDEDFKMLQSCGYQIASFVKVIAGRELAFSSLCFLDLQDDVETLKEKIQLLFEKPECGNITRVKGFALGECGGYQINATQYEMLVDVTSLGQGVVIVIGTNLNETLIRECLVQ